MPPPKIPLDRVPRLRLGVWPTPIERLHRLGASLGGRTLWIKRDDRSAPTYGGTKVRPLEFLLPRARPRGHALTVGGLGSTFAAAAAVHGACHGVRLTVAQFPQPVTPAVQAIVSILDNAGVQRFPAPWRALLPVALVRAWVAARRRYGTSPFWLRPGGADPYGVLGYLAGFLELAAQIEEGVAPRPDLIAVAMGSGGTLAGLTLGVRWVGWPTRVVGVRVADRIGANRFRAAALARQTARLLERLGSARAPRLRAVDIEIWPEYLGPGYGEPTEAATRALALARDTEDLVLDLTYTGKAMAGLLGRAPTLSLSVRNILFWHTFYSPAPEPAIPFHPEPYRHVP